MRTLRFVAMVLIVASGLTFGGGTAHAQAGTTTVTPRTDLVNGQTVSVTGSGWPASTSLSVLECASACFPDELGLHTEHVTTDSAGDFSTTYVLQRFFPVVCDVGVCFNDCVSARCFILVVIGQTETGTVTLLSFRRELPTPDLVIRRRSDGKLFFDDVGSRPYFHAIAPGGTWTFAVLVQNDGGGSGDITVSGSSVAPPFSVQYFFGYYDVTAAVTGSGLVLPAVAPGDSRLLAVRFSAAPATPVNAVGKVTMTASGGGRNDVLFLRVIAGP